MDFLSCVIFGNSGFAGWNPAGFPLHVQQHIATFTSSSTRIAPGAAASFYCGQKLKPEPHYYLCQSSKEGLGSQVRRRCVAAVPAPQFAGIREGTGVVGRGARSDTVPARTRRGTEALRARGWAARSRTPRGVLPEGRLLFWRAGGALPVRATWRPPRRSSQPGSRRYAHALHALHCGLAASSASASASFCRRAPCQEGVARFAPLCAHYLD